MLSVDEKAALNDVHLRGKNKGLRELVIQQTALAKPSVQDEVGRIAGAPVLGELNKLEDVLENLRQQADALIRSGVPAETFEGYL